MFIKKISLLATLFVVVAPGILKAQEKGARLYTHADSLRGSINKERAWWDVQRYDIVVKPDYKEKTTSGESVITYKVLSANKTGRMQIDLQKPLNIDTVLLNGVTPLSFTREGNAWYVDVPGQQKINSEHTLRIVFSGTPQEGVRPPWIGGWTFAQDSLKRPWMTITCQGLGASVWYPCKDHQSDEPDKGASLTMIVPDTLVAVANGKLISVNGAGAGLKAYKWSVVSPINNYNIIPYIGKYVHFDDSYAGEKGKLNLDFWVLDYNLNKAKAYMPGEVKRMLKAFEYWFGPYAFYADGYKLVDAPHTGMEHQSAIAYGNWYKPGYRMKDGSGTGWGMRWDFIIVHESGHEWFGNNITSNDLADMWIHESFTNYSETLYVDYHFGEAAGNAYNVGIRRGINNDAPIIPAYGVNAQGSGDMYPKGGNMLQTIRHSMGNDELFRSILRGLNKEFYHKTVDAKQIIDYVSAKAGYNYSPVFDQYLRNVTIPELELTFNKDSSEVSYKWKNCSRDFNLPLILKKGDRKLKIIPGYTVKRLKIKPDDIELLNKEAIMNMYYISVR